MLYPPKTCWRLIVFALVVLCLVIMFFCMTTGPAHITFKEAFLLSIDSLPFVNIPDLVADFPLSHQTIVSEVRMPRVILAALVGAALAGVGTTMQGLFKNPMADPYILGVSAGASLGAALAIVTGAGRLLGMWSLPLYAFLGAIISTWLAYFLARIGNKVPVYTLLLAGIALSSFLNALMSFIMIRNSRELKQIVFWMLGSFSGSNWSQVKIAFPFILLGLSALLFFAKDLNALLFGEDTAQNLGVHVEQIKKLLLFIAALTVAAAVSVSGTIGFVGLMVPHIVRLVTGPDHRILLPAGMLAGAIFMMVTDSLARTILAPIEIPVGIITAFLGGPFFIYLIKRKNIKLF